MHLSSASAVRLLAAWQQQRRELTDRVDTLLLHGPTAVDRVAARAEELRQALEAERTAFEAFVAVVARPDRGSAPPVVEHLEQRTESVLAYPRLRAVTDAGL